MPPRPEIENILTGRASFRRLAESDLPLLHRWLNLPHVLEWWDRPGPTLDDVRAKYLPRTISGAEVEPYIIEWDGIPIGYIQRYPVREGEWGLRNVGRSVGVDLFIGHARYLGRGLGSRLLRQFLGGVVFADPSTDICYIDPSPRNAGAIRAFERAGFRAADHGHDPAAPDVHLMRATRAEFDQPTDDAGL